MGCDGFSIEHFLKGFFGIPEGYEEAFGESGDLVDVVVCIVGGVFGEFFGDADAFVVVACFCVGDEVADVLAALWCEVHVTELEESGFGEGVDFVVGDVACDAGGVDKIKW